MPFFERPRLPPEDDPEHDVFADASDACLGGVVPFEAVLARSQTGAVAIRGLVAYPDGFAFTVVAYARSRPPGDRRRRLRPGPMMMDFFDLYDDDEQADELPSEFLRFGVEFPDGARVSNLTPPWPSSPDATEPPHGLEAHGCSGSDSVYEQEFWAWPLPAEGNVVFACDWPLHEIPETTVKLDGTGLREAAQRAQPLWPDAVRGRSHISRAGMFSRVREVRHGGRGSGSDQSGDTFGDG